MICMYVCINTGYKTLFVPSVAVYFRIILVLTILYTFEYCKLELHHHMAKDLQSCKSKEREKKKKTMVERSSFLVFVLRLAHAL